MKKISLILAFLFCYSAAFAQETDHLSVKYFLNKDSYTLSDTIKISLKIDIKDKYHINSFNTSDPAFIKTTVTSASKDFNIAGQYFPEHKMYKFEFSETQIPVYEGEIYIGVNIIPSKGIKDGNFTYPLSFNYQACDNASCYPPKSVNTDIKFKIDNTSTSKEINQDIFKKIDYSKPLAVEQENKLTENERIEGQNPDEMKVSNFIEERGLFLGILIIFVWGLALNLTPCIYPLIPITISYFGSQASGNKFQSIMMGVFYAIGMAVTYSLLGLFAALTGSLLGTALQNPIVIIAIALIFIALASSMFGVWEIRIPQKLALAGNKNRAGLFGSLLMGLLVGFIAAPCIGPIVLSLLVYVGQLGNPLMGFFLFFVLSIGLGFPYIFLAAFSSSINKLPRSGEWMIGVKIIFGLVLMIMAINTLSPLIPENVYSILFPMSIILSGAYLIIIDNKGSNSKIFTKIKYIIAVGGIIFGTWGLKPDTAHQEVQFKMLTSADAIESSIISENKPVMIDFYADWCAQCKELDKYTYTDGKVVELSQSFNNIKIDLTKENPEISSKYNIKGLPVVIFMNSKGEELKELRVTGFLKPEEFEKRMNKVLESK